MEQCALCLRDRILRKSHLMPKALHKRIRSKDGLVSASTIGGSRYTDKQIRTRLLCDDCEGMFSKKGEGIVCRECYGGKGNFILYDKLKAGLEMFAEKGGGWIVPQKLPKNINLDYEAYLYFGASIIWRASAGRWPRDVGSLYGCLGSYEDKFRRYLLGEVDFPENVFLTISVNNDEEEEEGGFNSIAKYTTVI